MQTQTAPLSPPLVYDRDREFDQTARSETPGPRTVSPSILEFKIQTLEKEIRLQFAENRDLLERLRVANERIAGFEKLSAGLAAKIDEFERGFQAVTGATAAEFAAQSAQAPNHFDISRCYRPCTAANGIAACVLDADHDGTCKGA